jgi:hypothetical protein
MKNPGSFKESGFSESFERRDSVYFLAVILRLIEAFFLAWFFRFFIFCVRLLRPLPI